MRALHPSSSVTPFRLPTPSSGEQIGDEAAPGRGCSDALPGRCGSLGAAGGKGNLWRTSRGLCRSTLKALRRLITWSLRESISAESRSLYPGTREAARGPLAAEVI